MEYQLRKAKQEDALAIVEVNTKCWQETYKGLVPEMLLESRKANINERTKAVAKAINHENENYVAIVNNQIVGYVTYGKSRDSVYTKIGEIYSLYILKQYQGLKIGESLLLKAIKGLLNLGYNQMMINVLVNNNNINFYKKYNGLIVGNRTDILNDFEIKTNVILFDDINTIYNHTIAKKMVNVYLHNDKTGHDMTHAIRVYNLAMKFSDSIECDKLIVGLVALLHDVDDYKLVGLNQSKTLENTYQIFNKLLLTKMQRDEIINAINTIGYSKRLNGVEPQTIEAQIVSDADMCDALGANGILRTHAYSLSKNCPFFNDSIRPNDNLTHKNYINKVDTSVCHIFEKILKLPTLMLTNEGRNEAAKREIIVIEFLRQLFIEEGVSWWLDYLEQYLNNRKRHVK